MSATREAFSERFGSTQAQAVWDAAEAHRNGHNDEKLGDDQFKWALLICIGYECMSKDNYRNHHAITASWQEIKQWIKDHADLASHNGDCDYLCMFAGGYNDYMPDKTEATATT